jgi:hypothetical protein
MRAYAAVTKLKSLSTLTLSPTIANTSKKNFVNSAKAKCGALLLLFVNFVLKTTSNLLDSDTLTATVLCHGERVAVVFNSQKAKKVIELHFFNEIASKIAEFDVTLRSLSATE